LCGFARQWLKSLYFASEARRPLMQGFLPTGFTSAVEAALAWPWFEALAASKAVSLPLRQPAADSYGFPWARGPPPAA
jgi:hypothetical protein